jgi:glutamate racemase
MMTENLNCILVPSDFSEPALHALRQHSECPVLTVNAPAAKLAARHARQEVTAVAHQ